MALTMEPNTASIDSVPSICKAQRPTGSAHHRPWSQCAVQESSGRGWAACHSIHALTPAQHAQISPHLHQLALVVANHCIHVGMVCPQAVPRLLLRVIAALHLQPQGHVEHANGRAYHAGDGLAAQAIVSTGPGMVVNRFAHTICAGSPDGAQSQAAAA